MGDVRAVVVTAVVVLAVMAGGTATWPMQRQRPVGRGEVAQRPEGSWATQGGGAIGRKAAAPRRLRWWCSPWWSAGRRRGRAAPRPAGRGEVAKAARRPLGHAGRGRQRPERPPRRAACGGGHGGGRPVVVVVVAVDAGFEWWARRWLPWGLQVDVAVGGVVVVTKAVLVEVVEG